MNNEIEGLIYIPKWVGINQDYTYGEVVTHEAYNELLNLNKVQGDYNTDVLRKMFTSNNPEDTYHIPYLDTLVDSAIEQASTALNTVNLLNATVNEIQLDLDATSEQVNSIQQLINTAVPNATHATEADHAVAADYISSGVSEPEMRYYGTGEGTDSSLGFHDFPNYILADEYQTAIINTIPITPAVNSVTEAMLTADVRTKLNREMITDYESLLNLPSLGGVTISGAKSLAQYGIQPAGNYLTEVPDTYSTTAEMAAYVAEALEPYLTSTQAATTYRTEAQVSSAITTALTPYLTSASASNTYLTKTTAASSYNKVTVSSTQPSNPKAGDLWITV